MYQRKQRGKCSKKKCVKFLHKTSKISILVSDVATASEMEQEIKLKCKEIERLLERLNNLNVELEWKQQYQNQEKEKECLFVKIKSEKEKKYVRKLEKGSEGSIRHQEYQ